jgi:cupin 2 domain-containing protein
MAMGDRMVPVSSIADMSNITNIYQAIQEHLPEEQFDTLMKAGSVRIQRIVSHGHVTSDGRWYDQSEHEWIIVLKGGARLQFDDETEPVEMRPGDCLNIPAHRRHRVIWTTKEEATIWLAVFYTA